MERIRDFHAFFLIYNLINHNLHECKILTNKKFYRRHLKIQMYRYFVFSKKMFIFIFFFQKNQF